MEITEAVLKILREPDNVSPDILVEYSVVDIYEKNNTYTKIGAELQYDLFRDETRPLRIDRRGASAKRANPIQNEF